MKRRIAFDIETLERIHIIPLPPITCICLYDDYDKKEYKLRFWKLPEEEYEANKKLVVDLLDSASTIVGYNAVLFDLEFIKRSFDIGDQQMTAWVRKTVDIFMLCKYVLKTTCKLDNLLTLNKLSNKTGSGQDAIVLATEGKWQELLDYCMADTLLTYALVAECSPILISDVLQIQWDVYPQIEWRKQKSIPAETLKLESIDLPLVFMEVE